MLKKSESLIQKASNPSKLESEHVNDVYNTIASHFSKTRYKPWPVIENFLKSKARGSAIADVGCGNGKYMCVNDENLFYFGADRSENLVKIAGELHPKASLIVGDALNVPFRDGIFDHAISIAVIHHMSTEERRIKAVQELLRIVKPKGQILIFVWAMEQTETSRYKFEDQDVFVPWSLNRKKEGEDIAQVYQRFYHVFREDELIELVNKASRLSGMPCRIVSDGYDKDNWYVIIERE